MSPAHDLASAPLAASSESGSSHPARPGAVDPLSDVLRTVRLEGAQFFQVDASDPWCVDVPRAQDYAGIILPTARHVVSYHIVLAGAGVAALPGLDPVAFAAGDILVFPHTDPYRMSSTPGVPPELDRAQTLGFFRDLAAGRLPFVIAEGGVGKPLAQFVCGFLGCDVAPYNPLLASLPRLLHIRRPATAKRDLLDRLTDMALAEAQTTRTGGDRIRLGLSELMFVELLRRYLSNMAAGALGWLAGLRDPAVHRALALIHADPARSWTLAVLARESGVSRSILADRFAGTVGQTPMRYLSLWRIQLAARLLTERRLKVADIAGRVGFASEAAFSRAFKKTTGSSPDAWRRGQSRFAG